MSETGDTDALAAEYALGTLDGPERAQAQAMLGVDQGFAAKVRLWERRLGELHLIVEPVEPDGEIWHRIKGKIPEPSPEVPAPAAEIEAAGESVAEAPESTPGAAAAAAVPEPSSPAAPLTASPVAPVMPAPSPPVPSSPTTPVTLPPAPGLTLPPTPAPLTPALVAPEPAAPPEPLIRAPMEERPDDGLVMRRRLWRWRVFAALLLLLLLAVGGLIAAWRYAPDRVPARLQAVELLRLVGVTVAVPPAPIRSPAPPESQFDE